MLKKIVSVIYELVKLFLCECFDFKTVTFELPSHILYFQLTLLLQRIPRNDCCPSYERPSQVQDTPSESSADSSDDYTNEEDDWDSGEGNTLLPNTVE